MPNTTALEKLKHDLVIMGEMCENSISTSILALIDRDEEMALQAIEYDREINEMELAIDADCLDLLNQEKLEDKILRFVVIAMKIARELERIGDNAVEICEHVLFLVHRRSVLPQIIDFSSLVEQCSQMMRESVRALVEEDVNLAWKLIDEYLVIQDEKETITTEVLQVMYESPRAIERCVHILGVAYSLGRVAALATNLAEEVIFLVEGKDIRHHIKEHHPFTPDLLKLPASPEEDERTEMDAVRRSTRRLKKSGRRKPGSRFR
ncbi:MAG: phosphate signaling complex protein PhoU [Planctomycetes bacterium]|nr:phosphate signaling complex protein PhoU [Planctomycetota bacterium]